MFLDSLLPCKFTSIVPSLHSLPRLVELSVALNTNVNSYIDLTEIYQMILCLPYLKESD